MGILLQLTEHHKIVNEVLEREQIDENLKWNLKDIYQSDENWEEDFKWVENNLSNYNEFKGKLNTSASFLLQCLKFDEKVRTILDKLDLYSMLAKDSDLRIQLYQSYSNRVNSLKAKLFSESSFIKPEILQIDKSLLDKWIDDNSDLKIYQHFFDNIFRSKQHTLNSETESILSLTQEIAQTPYNTFNILTNADIKFPIIKDEDGKDFQISHGRFYSSLFSKNRIFRESVYKSYMNVFKDFANSLSNTLNGNLKANIFYSKVRKFNSALEAALFKDNIPTSVYTGLIDSVSEYLKPMHRWAEFKRKKLQVDKLKPFDTYVSLFATSSERKYSYDEAKVLIKNSLKIFGEDYLSILDKAFNERWIDVLENKGKRSGAYSSGVTYGVHPYVLLNWNYQLNDVFTFAHEMGHNLHSYYTGITQPYIYADYSIFLAEVASTVNEGLLLEYLTNTAFTNEEKILLIEKYLNNITTTFYRQIMFAEFEMKIYEISENGQYLTVDDLCKLYSSVYKKYWGDSIDLIEEESYTWARIPHFYYNFYVFQYATGFAASEMLLDNFKHYGQESINKYLNFLKSGSKKYPLDILKDAGVDMTESQPIIAVASKMDSLLNQLEQLTNNYN